MFIMPSQMETSHLVFSLRAIWNGFMPDELKLDGRLYSWENQSTDYLIKAVDAFTEELKFRTIAPGLQWDYAAIQPENLKAAILEQRTPKRPAPRLRRQLDINIEAFGSLLPVHNKVVRAILGNHMDKWSDKDWRNIARHMQGHYSAGEVKVAFSLHYANQQREARMQESFAKAIRRELTGWL
ncbi:MAG: hypothetical protein ACRDC4_03785 [Plesiomonas sp.]